MEKINVLVVPAGGAGIGIRDSLKTSSYWPLLNVFTADSNPYAGALYTGDAHPILIPPLTDESRFVEAIFRIVKDKGIRVLFVANEQEACILASERENLLRDGCVWLCPPPETLRAAANKWIAAQTAHRVGVPAPKTVRITNVRQLDDFHLDFPVVMKPNSGRGARGICFAATMEELRIEYSSVSESFSDLIVQEEIPGGPGSIFMVPMLYDQTGRLIAAFCSHSLKTLYQWGGYAIVGEPVRDSHIIEMAQKLIGGFGKWIGPVSVEFKKHAKKGEPYLLEINTRLNGYNYLACAAGLNFAEMQLRASMGEELTPVDGYSTDLWIIKAIQTRVMSKSELESELISYL